MKHLPILMVCFSLFLLAIYEQDITNPASTDVEVEYQVDYEKRWQKGYLDESDITKLKVLEDRYINSDERKGKFKAALGYKFVFALLIAVWTFICCRWFVSSVKNYQVIMLSVFVLITFIPIVGVISSTFYAIFCQQF